MQTFLAYPDFAASAACLDDRRLGKQRVECLQILRALRGLSTGWRNHPAVLMWKGHEGCLHYYGDIICKEWTRRGYIDNCAAAMCAAMSVSTVTKLGTPPWLGDDRLHSAHRAALLAKDPAHYRQFGWAEEPKIDYWWPTKELAA